MKKTLLEDLEKIYHLIKCEDEDNFLCIDCDCCRNRLICDITLNLVCSIRKFY